MIGNKFLSVAGASEPTDAQFNYVTMLLHGDGTNGAQNNTFLDSSTNNFTITRNGNTTQGAFSPYGPSWSNYFNGSTDYLSLANSTALTMGTGDFTVEAWVYLSSVSVYSGIVSLGRYLYNGGIFRVTDSAKLQWYFNDASLIITSTNSVLANTWTHVAVVRSSGTTKLYINGVNSGSSADSSNYNSTYATLIGADYQNTPSNLLAGYVSNVRVVKGTAVYTGNFTPSTTPLTAISGTSLLTCQSNRFIDNSTNVATITVIGTPSVQRFQPFLFNTSYTPSTIGGSGYFDGTGDYLTSPDNTAVELGSGNFTIEAWIYPKDDAWQTIATKSASSQTSAFQFYAYQNAISFFASAGSSWNIGFYTGAVLVVNAWNHVAVTRSGTSWTIWVNGVSSATATGSVTINNNTDALHIGAFPDGFNTTGYMCDFRLVKGTALYTTTFTPPTAPITAVSGTSVLCNFQNGAIYDNAMMNDLETVGNAQISTSVKKFGTGSVYFDGTGDYLSAPNSPQLNMGSGNFTIEGWFYPSGNVSGGKGLFGKRANNGVVGGILFYFSSTGLTPRLLADIGGSWGVDITASSGFTDAQWNHFAVVRNGSTWTIYINGTSVGSTTNSGTVRDSTAAFTWMAESANASEGTTAGYLDDLRITKGYARTITLPTAAFPDKSSS